MSTTATRQPDHRSLPRKKHPPTERDQAIFFAYRTQGQTQEQLAQDLHLSQRRISQIIHRVQHWLADAPTCNVKPGTCNSLDHNQLQRLERQLERERAQAIYDRSLRAFDRGVQELKTTRQGKRGETPYQETAHRELLPSPQLLRVALRANRDLGNIADKPAPPPPPKPQDDQQVRWKQTLTSLYRARQQAEDEKKVTQGHGHLDYLGTVQHWLDALLGNRPDYFHPDDSAPGTPLHELATFYPVEHAPSSAEHRPETSDVEPETCDPQSEPWNEEPETPTPSNASNLAPSPESSSASQPEPAAELTRPATKQNQKLKPTPPRSSSSNLKPETRNVKPPRLNPEPRTLNPYDRLLLRDQRLDDLRDHIRSGLPFMMEWDSSLGPPPALSHHLDDPGCSPPPPNKNDEAQMVKDYLAKTRAEQLANA